MRIDRFEETDKMALYSALLALRTCPVCRNDLTRLPPEQGRDMWGCDRYHGSWHLPPDGTGVA